MKKVIIFDFFNVLANEISPAWMRRYMSDEAADIAKADIVGKADTGVYSEMKMYEELSKLTGISPEDIKKQWNDLVFVRQDMVSFATELSKSYKTVLLSNAPEGFLDRILDEHDLRKLFNSGIIISANVGLAKPGEEIFKMALSVCGEPAENAVFIDDNSKNIAGCEKVGIDGILFKGIDDLKQQLKYYKINI